MSHDYRNATVFRTTCLTRFSVPLIPNTQTSHFLERFATQLALLVDARTVSHLDPETIEQYSMILLRNCLL